MLMKKEALIEFVAYVHSVVVKRVEPDSPIRKEEARLAEIRDFLYSTSPENIDYQGIIDEVNAIKQDFIDLPILPRYR